MNTTKKENYIIIDDHSRDISSFATELSKSHSEFKNDNVIVNVLDKGNLEAKDLLVFLEVSDVHRKNKRSFVIASNPLEVENLPEDLIIAPTLREAEDIINMEELERELGF